MNAAYFIEFGRGSQLLKAIPELGGAVPGIAQQATPEMRAITKAVISERQWDRPGSMVHHKWVSEIAARLAKRRNEFFHYRKIVGPQTFSATIKSLVEFAAKL